MFNSKTSTIDLVRNAKALNTLTESCELCGTKQPFSPVYPSKSIVQCNRCKLVFYQGDLPTTSLYTDSYFHGAEYYNYTAEKQTSQRNFRSHIQRLKSYVPNGRLFEIGCAYGYFLELAQSTWSIGGIDVCESAISHAKNTLGLKVQLGEFMDLKDPEIDEDRYDLICLWDTIEHLKQPVRTLEKAARWLRNGGYLALTTPDFGSFVSKFRKEQWRQIHPPSHLYYFSRPTLRASFERSGLEVVHEEYVGISRSSRWLLHHVINEKKWLPRPLFNVLTFGNKLDVPIYMNTYDSVFFIGKKKH